MKDLQTRGKVRKDLALNDDAGEPPIAVLRTRVDPIPSSSISGPLARTLLEPYRQERLELLILEIPLGFAQHFQQRESSNLW